jgi:hypothetical protein
MRAVRDQPYRLPKGMGKEAVPREFNVATEMRLSLSVWKRD